MLCLACVALILGAYTLISIVLNYIGSFWIRVVFLASLMFSLVLFAVFVVAVVSLLGGWKGGRSLFSCSALLALSWIIAFWYRYEGTILGDRIFFRLNQRSFEGHIKGTRSESSERIFRQISNGSLLKIFIHSPGYKLGKSGEVQATDDPLGELRGCSLDVEELEAPFYLVIAAC